MKKRVALISGGVGYEREISERSAENLFSFIDQNRYEIFLVHIHADGRWYISRGECKKYIKSSECEEEYDECFPAMLGGVSGFFTKFGTIHVDCAIPCLHGDFGEDGNIQGALSTARISYIGQSVYASALTSDKIYTKIIAKSLGIPTAKWVVSDGETCESAKRKAEANLSYPLFIKPARLGSSYGASPIFCEGEFENAFIAAKDYGSRLLIEQLVKFDHELECALFDDGQRMIFPGGRVLSDGVFYDYTSKYTETISHKTEVKTAAYTSTEKKIAEYSAALADIIGIRHLSRFDFFVTKDEKIFFNEINAFPGMTATSLYPRLVEGVGKKHGDFINLLIDKVCSDDRRI